MALPPQKRREVLFLLLYAQDFGSSSPDTLTSMIMSELSVTKKNITQIQEEVDVLRSHLTEIDDWIGTASGEYAFSRIPGIERNVLRIALYEMHWQNALPAKVSISEAIRLTRKFATPEAAKFINGVLDTHYQRHRETIDSSVTQCEPSPVQLEEDESSC